METKFWYQSKIILGEIIFAITTIIAVSEVPEVQSFISQYPKILAFIVAIKAAYTIYQRFNSNSAITRKDAE